MIVTAAELSEKLNVTPRRIQQLVQRGVLPRAKRGQYDLVACAIAYIRFLQEAVGAKASTDGDGEQVSTKEQRAKLLSLQVRREEIALAKDESSLMAVADHELVLSSLVIEVKAAVNAIGARAAGKVVGEPDVVKVQSFIDAEARLALAALAKVTPAMPREDAEPKAKPKEKKAKE